ncbi:hypothetical protein [Otoolea muris]|uniref:hypothetical protein n=1 Tax=Otoolea muris TaxID=2941515 RepID=UPI00203E450E|nr:hypothetical protein [Otoolea muris]
MQQKKEAAGESAQEEDGNESRAHAGQALARRFLLIGGAAAFASLALFPWKYLMQFGWFRLAASYIQFPWRLVGAALCFLSLAGGYAVSRQWGGARRFRAGRVCGSAAVLLSRLPRGKRGRRPASGDPFGGRPGARALRGGSAGGDPCVLQGTKAVEAV